MGMKKLALSDLNQLYTDSEECDTQVFSEMRSNILLAAGEHYSKSSAKVYARLRDQNKISDNAKLRLTKNHIHKITRYYEQQILSKSPGVIVRPKNESELQDRKDAELNQAVWVDVKTRHKFKDKIRRWVKDFVDIGEVACKVYWDPNKGELIGYSPKMSDDGKTEVLDEKGAMVADEGRPIFQGDWGFESIPGYDLLRSRSAHTMSDSPYFIYRKMVDKKYLMGVYADSPEKLKSIQDSDKETYVIFDSNNQNYQKEDKRIMVRETYYRPCFDYPKGYFYIATEFGILEEGELPEGIFPIIWKGFDEFSGTPRARSIIKVARPFQAEINRASSQLATHQVTVGDDKVIYQAGTKLQPGALLPGVRGITFQGAPPTILAGRDGSQFMGYIEQQISEMYDAVMMEESMVDDNQNQDPYSNLFKSIKQQTRFGKYAEKFEEFLSEICELTLKLAKFYLPDNMLVGAVGRAEFINISEFRKTTPLAYQIVVEEQTDSADTQFGRQLTLNHLLQYAGTNLNREDVGKIMKNMPFVNNKEIFSDFTINYESVENDMLALERGEVPTVEMYADNKYYVDKLTHRTKQGDFKFLDETIQQNYHTLIAEHEQEIARKEQAIIDAKNEYIPVGGALIKCDMYVPNESGKVARAEVPYQALDWLIKQLSTQGMSLEQLKSMNSGAQADISQMITQNQQGAGQMMPSPEELQ